NQTYSGRALKPDVTQVYNGTYSAAKYYPAMGSMGIGMNFSGTAVYVFLILANYRNDGAPVPWTSTVTRANFSVDGGSPVPFLHISNLSTTALQYNSLVFSLANLSNGDHRLDITTTGSTDIYVNFDYAVYT
ncbi:hypothetical protein K443DRAFT_99321, partial [Laccaria amethystina LaAM-08-1]